MEPGREVLAQRLLELLEEEFEALKRRDLDLFEQLQPGKTRLLESLAAAAPTPAAADNAEASPTQQEDPVRELLLRCRDAHRRNETLMSRQLEAVRGALQALTAQSGLDTVEVYDRLGQLRSRGGGRGYSEA